MHLKPFSRIRSFLWPIHGHEHKKLLPIFALFFLLTFVYDVLRCMKVTLVVTANGSSAEVIPFLKVWAVLPGAILLTYIYTKLSNRLNREQIFYAMIAIFLGFFTLFMVVLHPHREALELRTLTSFLEANLPPYLKGLSGLLMAIRHWHLSLFYVLSELWGTVMLSMLFWGFANEITTVDEAKRFYAIFSIGVNSSGIFSGQFAQFLTLEHFNPRLPFGTVVWEQSLILQLSVLLAMGLAIVLLFRYLNRSLLRQDTRHFVEAEPKSEESTKLSLTECFGYLRKSRYMIYIAVLVVAYNIAYNLFDVVWTGQIHARYPDASEFNAYYNNLTSITGVFATFFALLLSGNVIRRYGWTVTAMLTPLIMLLMSFGFFGSLLIEGSHSFSDVLGALLGVPLHTLVWVFGAAQMCLGRAAKYTVFDESKEIAFIPLSREEQRKGKAVVDGIASRCGKSGGSILIQTLLVVCGELALTIPYLAVIFVVVVVLWMVAIGRLGKMASKTIDQEMQTKPEEGALVLSQV